MNIKRNISVFSIIILSFLTVLGCQKLNQSYYDNVILSNYIESNGGYDIELDQTITPLYYEGENLAGFINDYSGMVDPISTYKGSLIANKVGRLGQYNVEKICNYALLSLKQSILNGNLSNDLENEKYVIKLMHLFALELDDDVIGDIVTKLSDHLDAFNATISDENHFNEHKVIVHCNYIVIMNLLERQVQPHIQQMILENLNTAMSNANPEDQYCMRAIYYEGFIRHYFNLLDQELEYELIRKLMRLRDQSGGYMTYPDSKVADVVSTSYGLATLVRLGEHQQALEAIDYILDKRNEDYGGFDIYEENGQRFSLFLTGMIHDEIETCFLHTRGQ